MLLDTGASDSAISGRVADRLGLRVLGFETIVGFGSAGDSVQYLADVDLILEEVFPLGEIPLFRFETESDRVQGILGRDILARGTLFLDGPNRTFTLTF
jgi:hypothetical protein